MRAAKKAGIQKCVVLNSYFAYFDRIWPGLQLRSRHAYIRCRVEQAASAIAEGNGMEVCILELPYIFGTMPGRVPLWKDLLIARLHSMHTVVYPKGGTAMIGVSHVAEAIAGAILYGKHGMRYPVGDVNMEWKDMLRIMLIAMGENKKITYLPKFLVKLEGVRIKKQHQKEGLESGIDPLHLFDDIMCRFLYFDPGISRQVLLYGSGGIEETIAETVKKCL
jgi:nucleoside-diphosphate-sugar epimerase